jgi:hypothetical protein
MTRLFTFYSESQGITALTLDESGASLPADLGPWRHESGAALPLDAAAGDALREALEADGYYLARGESLFSSGLTLQVGEETYRRAEQAAAAVLGQLRQVSPSIVGCVAALQLATVKMLAPIDPSGTALEAFISDLRRIFAQVAGERQGPDPELRH